MHLVSSLTYRLRNADTVEQRSMDRIEVIYNLVNAVKMKKYEDARRAMHEVNPFCVQ